tara:strand:- start:1134 stop:1853 length:720 start_codon:yes stop_codon:yes gene_type:complete
MEENINKSIESYLEGDYQKFKNYERIKFLTKNLCQYIDKKKNYKLLDLGCSKGEIIYSIKEKFDNVIDFTGIDISRELIKKAQGENFLKSVRFIEDDISTFSLNEKFDLVVMSGVLSIFDDYENFLLNAIKHMKKNSVGFVFSAFNKQDIDVIIRYRNNFIGSNQWESGWNLFSLKGIKKFLIKYSQQVKIIPFHLQNKIEQKENPVLSYTVETKNESNLILTGGNIVRDFYLIVFKTK